MKKCVGLLLILFCHFSYAQKPSDNFNAIDRKVNSIEASNLELLAQKLTTPYPKDIEKVRAIYSWIATHIAYNMGIFSWKIGTRTKYAADYDDSFTLWKTADEMVAERVLKRKVAVCDGYARLFKTLCLYSGIPAELVLGYVRAEPGKERFRTNHTWNAVMIDSSWQLVDVTWGSGFVTYSNEFVQQLDDYYFLTPPDQLIRNHYPEDPKWTLLNNPPMLHEFKSSPFKCRAFVKYGISSFSPSNGVIEASVGDTLKMELQLDVERAKKIASSNYDDSLRSILSYAVVEPAMENGNKVTYTYVLTSSSVEWLELVYNKDVVLRYRINERKTIIE